MAKANKPENGSAPLQQEEAVVETTAIAQPTVETAKRSPEKKQEIALKYGECIIAPVNDPEEEILTTISDWESTYNAGSNQGKFVLKAEKKS